MKCQESRGDCLQRLLSQWCLVAEFLPGGRQGFEPRRVRELETILRKEPWCMFHKLVAGTLKIDNTYYCITDYNIYIYTYARMFKVHYRSYCLKHSCDMIYLQNILNITKPFTIKDAEHALESISKIPNLIFLCLSRYFQQFLIITPWRNANPIGRVETVNDANYTP